MLLDSGSSVSLIGESLMVHTAYIVKKNLILEVHGYCGRGYNLLLTATTASIEIGGLKTEHEMVIARKASCTSNTWYWLSN